MATIHAYTIMHVPQVAGWRVGWLVLRLASWLAGAFESDGFSEEVSTFLKMDPNVDFC